jgi:hypothetical protein
VHDISGPKHQWGVYGHRSEANIHKFAPNKCLFLMKDITHIEHEREPESFVRVCIGQEVHKLSPMPHSAHVATLWYDAIKAGMELQKYTTEKIQGGRERLVEEANRPSNFTRQPSFQSDDDDSGSTTSESETKIRNGGNGLIRRLSLSSLGKMESSRTDSAKLSKSSVSRRNSLKDMGSGSRRNSLKDMSPGPSRRSSLAAMPSRRGSLSQTEPLSRRSSLTRRNSLFGSSSSDSSSARELTNPNMRRYSLKAVEP